MKKITKICMIAAVSIEALFPSLSIAQPSEVWIIRHGEKPKEGYNLTCKGLNRSLLLPDSLYSQMGEVASKVYVPKLNAHNGYTSHSRMFQTATPYAVRYNVDIDSRYSSEDPEKVVDSVNEMDGKVLMVWNHSDIKSLVKEFKVTNIPDGKKAWPDSDFDSIWVINMDSKTMTIKKENLVPGDVCTSY